MTPSVMNRILLYCTAIVFLGSCDQKSTNQDASSGAVDGWVTLIDDDLSQWDKNSSLQAEVVNGTLSLTGMGDHPTAMLTTTKTYDNFHMKMEVQSSDTQSSIFIRLNDELSTDDQRAGYSISIDANLDQLNPMGTIYSVARSTIPEGFDSKQWNSLEVTAVGTHLMITLNGKLVAEANDKHFKSGKIGLQVPPVEGNTVRFKNLEIQGLVTIAMVTELLEDRYRSDTRPWENLFDGNSLDGWNAIGDGTWVMEEGVLHGYSGVEGGFLVSEKAYKDFYLLTKFKIKKEDNSGIYIRKSPDSTGVTITDAIECNIYDHNGPTHAYSTGSIATHSRAWYGMIDYEEWNTMEIFSRNDQVVMFVNGTKSTEFYLPSHFNKTGNICLQAGIQVFAEDKGPSDIYFKDMKVKSMDEL